MDASATSSSTRPDAGESTPAKKRKHKNRPRRRRHRRQSFAPETNANAGGTTPTTTTADAAAGGRTMADETPPSTANANARPPFYRLGQRTNLSGTSLESEALLDHR
jgi:magnesium transporter